MDYNKDELEFQRETPVPPLDLLTQAPVPEKTPDTCAAVSLKQLSEEPVGFIFDSGGRDHWI